MQRTSNTESEKILNALFPCCKDNEQDADTDNSCKKLLESKTRLAAIAFIIGCILFCYDGGLQFYQGRDIGSLCDFVGSIFFLIGSLLWYLDIDDSIGDELDRKAIVEKLLLRRRSTSNFFMDTPARRSTPGRGDSKNRSAATGNLLLTPRAEPTNKRNTPLTPGNVIENGNRNTGLSTPLLLSSTDPIDNNRGNDKTGLLDV